MGNENKEIAWKYLIDLIFKSEKEISIEIIQDFKELSRSLSVDEYCDFLREKPFPETLREESWERSFLNSLSEVIPNWLRVLVLKGAAARDMELYAFPLLRKSTDLDLFIYKLDDFESQKNFICSLERSGLITPCNGWQKRLKKLSNIIATFEDRTIDIHFNLFSPIGNFTYYPERVKKRFALLEKEIIQRSYSYNSLKNICKMSTEDFWFYNSFNIFKDYPAYSFKLLLDLFLTLSTNKTTIEKLEEHAKKTGQTNIFKNSLLMLNQFTESNSKDFRVKAILYSNRYSIKDRLINSFSVARLLSNNSPIVYFYILITYFICNQLFSRSIEEDFSLPRAISNFLTKTTYQLSKFKNFLKGMCLKALPKLGSEDTIPQELHKIESQRELLSIKLEEMIITFELPIDFYNELANMFEYYQTKEHKESKIIVEKVYDNEEPLLTYQACIFSEDNFYFRFSKNRYGKCNLNSNGILFTSNPWDVRAFANYLFRAISFKTSDKLLVHAGCIAGKNDNAIIFPGKSTTGKSTFYNILLANNPTFIGIGDDTILLKKEEDTWYAYPTPFISNKPNSFSSRKYKLSTILDIIKVTGGHEIINIDLNHSLAILINNSIAGFTIDDGRLIEHEIVKKIIDISKQINHHAKIKFSIKETEKLSNMFSDWLKDQNKVFKYGNELKRLLLLQGNSMQPILKDGDILVVDEIKPNDLKPKDIICFQGELKIPTAHRIKHLIKHGSETTIITKGDNNIFDDTPRTFKNNKKVLKVLNKLY